MPKKLFPYLLFLLVIVALIFGVNTTMAAKSFVIPLNATRSNCNGETVVLTGKIHMLSQVQADGSVVGHFNYQNVTGKVNPGGDIYRTSAVDHYRISAPVLSGWKSVSNFNLIGKGSSSNLRVKISYQLSVNNQGDVMVSIDTIKIQCK